MLINKIFTARLVKRPNKGGWTYVVWPESVGYFGTRGTVKISAKVDGVEFRSSFMAMGNGIHMLPIRTEIRKMIGKESGDSVSVELVEKIESYRCPECGLHYTDEAVAKQCEQFCRDHKACSLDITQQSVEASKNPS